MNLTKIQQALASSDSDWVKRIQILNALDFTDLTDTLDILVQKTETMRDELLTKNELLSRSQFLLDNKKVGNLTRSELSEEIKEHFEASTYKNSYET